MWVSGHGPVGAAGCWGGGCLIDACALRCACAKYVVVGNIIMRVIEIKRTRDHRLTRAWCKQRRHTTWQPAPYTIKTLLCFNNSTSHICSCSLLFCAPLVSGVAGPQHGTGASGQSARPLGWCPAVVTPLSHLHSHKDVLITQVSIACRMRVHFIDLRLYSCMLTASFTDVPARTQGP